MGWRACKSTHDVALSTTEIGHCLPTADSSDMHTAADGKIMRGKTIRHEFATPAIV